MLLFARTGRDAALSSDGLRHAGLPCVVCQTAEDLIGKVRDGAGPAVIVAEALSLEQTAALEAVLADEPAWSDLPLILVAGPASFPKHLGGLAARRNTTLLHRPLKMATFITIVRAALQNRLRQYEVRDLLHRLEGRARQLQRLAFELTETEERERQRLADLLHDDLQQILVGAKLQVVALARQPDHGQFEKTVAMLSELLDQAILQSRNLSHALNSPIVQQHGLPAGLQSLARQMRDLHELQVTVDADPEADPRDSRVRTFLYRSAQELLFNVAKHAGVADAHVHLASERGRVVLRVQDRGKGVDPAVLEGNGSGLGLLSIRDRAALFGGALEMRSNEGMGSTFTLVLPLESPPPAAPAPRKAATRRTSTSTGRKGTHRTPRLRILLADDHRVVRSGLRSMLELEEDLEVIGEADDGAQAVELAKRLRPDLILMDVSMPRLDGIKATQRIKDHHPEIRVIGVSMFDDEQSAMKMREAGAECYLSKTGAAGDLLAAVRSGIGT